MSSKKIIIILISIILLFTLFIMSDTPPTPKEKSEALDTYIKSLLNNKQAQNKYVCPMHSHILSDKQGKCPICGMDLVLNQSAIPLEHHSAHKQENALFSEVKISPLVVHNLGIKATTVQRGNLEHRIETIGKITRVDPMARSRITPPIAGTILNMNPKTSGDQVQQDEFLFSIASEKLNQMQTTFQQAFMTGDKATASAMIPILVAKGLDAGQIAQLQKGDKPEFPAKIYAQEAAYIFAKRGQKGDKVPDSYTVFNLGGDYQVIEVTVEIFERQWDLVKEGQKATMILRNLPGKTFEGIVDRVDEPVGYTTRALESRIKFKTPFKGLTQSTFARIVIEGQSKPNVLLAPRDAVIRTAQGDRIITITDEGIFLPCPVIIGEESNGNIEIISGIEEGTKIVVSGQFLIDSESNLLSGLRRFSAQQTQ